MFSENDKSYQMSKEEYDEIKERMKVELSVLQQQVIAAKIPVVILFEGFSASGKGSAISSLILNFDPRGYAVYSMREPVGRELRKPWVTRFVERCPAAGRISVFDRSWYSGLTWTREGIIDKEDWHADLEELRLFETRLADDGCVIIKFFLYISKKEQKRRLKELRKNEETAWRVTKADMKKLKDYDKYLKYYKSVIEITDCPHARWVVVNSEDRRYRRATVMQTVAEELRTALEKRAAAQPMQEAVGIPYVSKKHKLLHSPRIEEYNLNREITREEYDIKLKDLTGKLQKMHNSIYLRKIPVVIVFEGNDAAGKGGSIRRLTRALDPRGYEVIPISAPTREELARHYLWRFHMRLPVTGHFAIFDRSWYGRVLVERVEKLTPPQRILQAYNELNGFEYVLHNWGAIIVKFWMAIDKDEQLNRFKARESTPEKSWKLTEEDWRNRDKWEVYEDAINDMLRYTNTEFAPWTVVESNSKLFARIKVLETVVDALEKRLG
ncbi:MAG: polyphosphate:AMP phosphotransferase [Ruminococcaceae bacterium]|nr:polyphosphate:AMP phosphotransferase [Oscillospiraceae bacterium]